MSSQAPSKSIWNTYTQFAVPHPTPPSSESGEMGPKPRAPPFLSPKRWGTPTLGQKGGAQLRTGYTDSAPCDLLVIFSRSLQLHRSSIESYISKFVSTFFNSESTFFKSNWISKCEPRFFVQRSLRRWFSHVTWSSMRFNVVVEPSPPEQIWWWGEHYSNIF